MVNNTSPKEKNNKIFLIFYANGTGSYVVTEPMPWARENKHHFKSFNFIDKKPTSNVICKYLVDNFQFKKVVDNSGITTFVNLNPELCFSIENNMTGSEFYQYLRKKYTKPNTIIQKSPQRNFVKWLQKLDDSYSFQFSIADKYTKSISKKILIKAWETQGSITNEWIRDNFNVNFHNDCRINMLKHLIKEGKTKSI